MKAGNKKAGAGGGSMKMGGPGMKPRAAFGGKKAAPPMPSDGDGDEGAGAFKRGGKVAACKKGGLVKGEDKPGKGNVRDSGRKGEDKLGKGRASKRS